VFFSRPEVARTVVAPPSSVVQCLWGVFVWGVGVLFVSCVCVSVTGVLFSVGVCVCVYDLLIFLLQIHTVSASAAPPAVLARIERRPTTPRVNPTQPSSMVYYSISDLCWVKG